MTLQVWFWLFFVAWVFYGGWCYYSPQPREYRYFLGGHVLFAILIGILGYGVFGSIVK